MFRVNFPEEVPATLPRSTKFALPRLTLEVVGYLIRGLTDILSGQPVGVRWSLDRQSRGWQIS